MNSAFLLVLTYVFAAASSPTASPSNQPSPVPTTLVPTASTPCWVSNFSSWLAAARSNCPHIQVGASFSILSEVTFKESTLIEGIGDPQLDAGANSRFLTVTNNRTNVTVTGLHFANGFGSACEVAFGNDAWSDACAGSIRNLGGVLVLMNVTFENSTAPHGGAIFTSSGITVVLFVTVLIGGAMAGPFS